MKLIIAVLEALSEKILTIKALQWVIPPLSAGCGRKIHAAIFSLAGITLQSMQNPRLKRKEELDTKLDKT